MSEAVGTVYVTVAVPEPGDDSVTVMFAGQVTVGACVSWIVTVNVHPPWLPAESMARHVTVVAPTGKVDPEAGRHTTATGPGQLSTPTGVVKLTMPEHWPGVFGCVMFAGHETVGACASLIVTVNEHVPSGLFADPSDAVHVTVVVPTGKVEPDAGTQFTVTGPGQLSVPVGVV